MNNQILQKKIITGEKYKIKLCSKTDLRTKKTLNSRKFPEIKKSKKEFFYCSINKRELIVAGLETVAVEHFSLCKNFFYCAR